MKIDKKPLSILSFARFLKIKCAKIFSFDLNLDLLDEGETDADKAEFNSLALSPDSPDSPDRPRQARLRQFAKNLNEQFCNISAIIPAL